MPIIPLLYFIFNVLCYNISKAPGEPCDFLRYFVEQADGLKSDVNSAGEFDEGVDSDGKQTNSAN